MKDNVGGGSYTVKTKWMLVAHNRNTNSSLIVPMLKLIAYFGPFNGSSTSCNDNTGMLSPYQDDMENLSQTQSSIIFHSELCLCPPREVHFYIYPPFNSGLASLAIKCSTMFTSWSLGNVQRVYQSFCAEVSWQQCLEARLMRTVVQNQTFDAAGLKIKTMSWKMPKSSIKLTVTTECGYNYLWVHHYEHYMLSLEPLLI